MFTYKKVSAGEHLCCYLYDKLIDRTFWDRFQNRHLHMTGRAPEFRFFMQAAIALNLTRRLILAAEHATQFALPTDTGFLAYLDAPLNRLGLYPLNSKGVLVRMVRDSLVHSRHAISPTLRQHMLHWGACEHPSCYLCGCSLNFHLGSVHQSNDITLDHLWPQAYGGDSDEENLLPACRVCNQDKKRDFPLWAACNVHTLNIGHDASEEELKSVGGYFKFAVYNRAVTTLANREKITLKRAYKTLGPWLSTAYYIDSDAAGDFFNLGNHDLSKHEYGTELLQMS